MFFLGMHGIERAYTECARAKESHILPTSSPATMIYNHKYLDISFSLLCVCLSCSFFSRIHVDHHNLLCFRRRERKKPPLDFVKLILTLCHSEIELNNIIYSSLFFFFFFFMRSLCLIAIKAIYYYS